MALKVHIVARTHDVWEGEAESVVVPALSGELGILPGRQPILAALATGEVRVTEVGGPAHTFHVDGGFANVDQDIVTVLVDYAKLS
ncbi:MAG: F0F1 ATP synthase subunit epsilon [Buchananella hordeovulneris]|nr:F0F1 ATP synthase subunit epsilon [Buchananella hordeovulneris]